MAQILEQTDLLESQKSYNTAIKLFQEKVKVSVPPEIYSNLGSLNYRLGNYQEALKCFEKALQRSQAEGEKGDSHYYNSISVTISYNLGKFQVFLHLNMHIFSKVIN